MLSKHCLLIFPLCLTACSTLVAPVPPPPPPPPRLIIPFLVLTPLFTDITASLQAEIDRSNVVTLPEGTFLISGTLKPHPGLELRGAGLNKTTLLKTGAGHLLDWYGAWPKSGLTVRDLTLDANGIDSAVGLEWVSDVLFERVGFKRVPYWGINLGTVQGDDTEIRNHNVTVKDSLFTGNTGSYEFVLVGNAENVLLEGNTFEDAQPRGIGVGLYQQCQRITLKNNIFRNLHIAAYYSLGCDEITFDGNTFDGNGDGIQGANQSDHGNFERTHVGGLTITNNLFTRNAGTPLEIGAVDDGIISGNRFVDNLGVGMLVDSGNMPVSSAPRDLEITQNTFVGNNASGTFPDLHPDILLVGQGTLDLGFSRLEDNSLETPITFLGGHWTGLTLSPCVPVRLLEGATLGP